MYEHLLLRSILKPNGCNGFYLGASGLCTVATEQFTVIDFSLKLFQALLQNDRPEIFPILSESYI